jgi:uncharacterized membrane protein YkvA (DUF1232 family)
VSSENAHAPIIGDTVIQGLLYADDLAVSAFAINEVQKCDTKLKGTVTSEVLRPV